MINIENFFSLYQLREREKGIESVTPRFLMLVY